MKKAKKITSIVLVSLISITLFSSCGKSSDSQPTVNTESQTQSEQKNVLSDQYYIGSINYSSQVLRFNPDQVIEWVDCGLGRKNDKRTKYYGTYTIDGNKLVISMSGKDDMNCVILDEGDKLSIDGNTYDKVSDTSKLNTETLNAFD